MQITYPQGTRNFQSQFLVPSRQGGSEKRHVLSIFCAVLFVAALPHTALAAYHFQDFRGKPPIHVYGGLSNAPRGITPAEIKKIYHLPATGGHGTIAVVGAYDDASIETDLNDFSKQFGLPPCTTASGCFEKHVPT